ncbi:MAG: hypothetical protein A2487_16895 [Candidatus Raymondbacteria bacterium RifOxyC12_full_50_8]|uniref:Response regulatory domain-containing protein n=1 Tax=Candidatus Raymondbacteria bacterium RIFOXYD12_FULL_49_13 TaxID=1817890 RepID=A0A1F7F0J9_UNCRA|nr:MAG: hypothetical protein A2248_21770 [Candidatus Raymondbacteria bacterium RIFOXYA2_FULL_49_16]OGK00067.1 MAG: hypothetical protein A2519_22325 [Candidatus Raymondbacteria bacterium RIFOXYD12_FULL_49_13]OGK01356.1 MAG: hypothetical protein A2487_16895 [Candidatus Raymondbacteria bacterium RifOxyC12_full_50_8]OGK03684.1 MAG: hypothetical protein A2350_13005 [Candidatus Raymondbacteria bacterium RifOxyB12_full_50_8]OGP45056.1 MAG: hypothetical protein A2324_13650 [Candidatus Raymondbacteria b
MRPENDYFILALSGKITTVKECQETFETVHRMIMQDVKFIELDLSKVTDLSGSFAGFLTSLMNEIHSMGGNIIVSHADKNVRSVLMGTGLSGIIREPGEGRKKNKALLIDDDEDVRRITSESLKELDYLCIEAENGLIGLELYQRNKQAIAFIVLDMQMPVMDGEMFFNKILESDADARIIIATGYADQEKLVRMREKRHFEILKKPYFLRDLEAAIKRTLPQPMTKPSA